MKTLKFSNQLHKSHSIQSTNFLNSLTKQCNINTKHPNKISLNNIMSQNNFHHQSNDVDEKYHQEQPTSIMENNTDTKNKHGSQHLYIKITPSKKDIGSQYHRFLSQITIILTQQFKTPAPQLLRTPIPYIQYLSTLKSLKMINLTYSPYPNDLVSQLWLQYIAGNNVGYFIIIIASILGFYQGKQTQQDNYFKTRYQILRITRVQFQKAEYQQYRLKQNNEQQIKPRISTRIKKGLKTSSSISKKNTKCNTLNTDRTLTERINQSVCCEEKWNGDIQECCWKEENQYLHYTEPNTDRKNNQCGNIRTQILYQRAKQKPILRKINKTKQDIEYQRSINELTFKPKIKKLKIFQKQQPIKCIVKGQKNNINRMIRARVQKQVKKIINNKGMTYNQKLVDKMRKVKYGEIIGELKFCQQQADSGKGKEYDNQCQNQCEGKKVQVPKLQLQLLPLEQQHTKPNLLTPEQDLVIQVYISEQRKERLVVRKGQCLQEVASRFIAQHGLPQQKKEQLVHLLQISISHALCPIDELDEEDELASARSLFRPESFR